MAGMKFPLTAFADEISPDLDVQVRTLQRLNVQGLDLRSVDGINVLDLTVEQLHRIHDTCQAAGIHIQSIGSPVNKIPFDVLKQAGEKDKLNKAIKAAQHLAITHIRIFSPEVPEGQHDELATTIIEWLADQRRRAEDQGVVLLHENDARYWGAYPKNAKRLFENLGSPSFKAVFDFANTVLLGFDPLQDWFPWIVPYLDTLHIKDAIKAEGRVVPAGQGDAKILETIQLLMANDWNGPLTLEPHLQAAGPYGGFSGEALFEEAVKGIRDVVLKAGGEC